MINDLLKLEINSEKHIKFSDLPKDDIDAYLVFMSRTDWIYEIQDKLFNEKLVYIKNKYNLIIDINKWDEVTSIWEHKIWIIEELYNEEDFIKYVKYAKKYYIKIFWDEFWHKAYNNFLKTYIIWSLWNNFYLKFIKGNKKNIEYFHKEIKKLFKYYPNRWDLVWFAIDELYWYKYAWNIDEMDNWYEPDRYSYWIEYKDKWESKIRK